jgi:hypothetical protein
VGINYILLIKYIYIIISYYILLYIIIYCINLPNANHMMSGFTHGLPKIG